MKTDLQLQKDVTDELGFHPSLGLSDLHVNVKDGAVILCGKTESFFKKRLIEEAVKQVEGLRGYSEEIEVQLQAAYQKTDEEICEALQTTFEWSASIPRGRVNIKVEDGWVILDGDVDWYYQKECAERIVQQFMGVKGIIDFIHIKPQTTPVEVKAKIEEALRRHAEREAKGVHVRTEKGKVILTGTVATLAEKEDAKKAAWSIPGVYQVENNIKIAA